jgi:hypothetical protein
MSKPNFDSLLEKVLREDAAVEPLEGLEERVLHRVSGAPHRPAMRQFTAWWVLLATSACLAAMVWIAHKELGPGDAARISRASLPGVAPLRAGATGTPPGGRSIPTTVAVNSNAKILQHAVVRSRVSDSKRYPKLDTFPAPSQVSQPFQDLADLSRRRGMRVSNLKASGSQTEDPDQLAISPIKIASIQISPLFPLTPKPGEQVENH